MIFYKIGTYKFNVVLKVCGQDMLIAQISTPLIGMDKVFVNMYLPYDGQSETVIDMRYITENEMIEKAKKIIMKKMYKMSNDILLGIKDVNFDKNKYKGKYCVVGTFSHGSVYAEK